MVSDHLPVLSMSRLTLSYHLILMKVMALLMIMMKATFISDAFDDTMINSQNLILSMYLPSRVVVKIQELRCQVLKSA